VRPGVVTGLCGIVFQDDGRSVIGRLFIRPFEALDRWVAGIPPSRGHQPLAMHAGLHVVLEDGREVVVEQLVGALYMDLQNGLNWTPIDEFRSRDRGGWDLTLPATTFRRVDDPLVDEVMSRLNTIEGRAFIGEDCTAFVERAFGGRRLFADSPILRRIGIPARVGDPALPLIKPNAVLDERARILLHADAICNLPDAVADPESPNVRLWLTRLMLAASVGALISVLLSHLRRRT
jgi:hypothetical protein